MNCIKNERIKNEIIKNERIKNELIKKRTDPIRKPMSEFPALQRGKQGCS